MMASKSQETFQQASICMCILLAICISLQLNASQNDSSADVLVVEVETIHSSCYLANDGSASLTITGGVGPYEVTWQNTPNTGLNATGLYPGNFPFSVEDLGTGELYSDQVTITQPEKLLPYFSSYTNPTSCESCDGLATLKVEGGTPPYSIDWPYGVEVSEDGLSASGICGGELGVAVIDQNTCLSVASVVIDCSGQEDLEVTYDAHEPSCGCNNGNIYVNIIGGVGPFEILWLESGHTGFSLLNVGAGRYDFVVTDTGTGEHYIGSYTFTEPESLVAYFTDATNATSCEVCDGTASLEIASGTPPYSFSWPEEAIVSADGLSATGLCAGMIGMNFEDVFGCAAFAGTLIECVEPMSVAIENLTASCPDASEGVASVAIEGGTAPYSILWSNGLTTSMVSGLAIGTYTVNVTDYNGHSQDLSIQVLPSSDCTDETTHNGENPFVGDLISNIEVHYDTGSKVWLINKHISFLSGQPISIYTTAGSLVRNDNLESRTTLLNTSNLRSGVYLVQTGTEVVRILVR